MKNRTVIRYHVYKEKKKVRSFRYLKKARLFALATRAEAIDKEIILKQWNYTCYKSIPGFIEYKF